MKNQDFRMSDRRGFTMVEMLMVVLLVSILAAIGITQYKDFSTETKNAATKANLQILRNGISSQFGQSRLRCNQTSSVWPAVDSINANDVTGGAAPLCTTAQVTSPADRRFVGGQGLPINPWGGTGGSSTVYDCVVSGSGTANPPANACLYTALKDCSSGAALSNTSDGWCYNPVTGQLWANSARNDGANLATGNENTF